MLALNTLGFSTAILLLPPSMSEYGWGVVGMLLYNAGLFFAELILAFLPTIQYLAQNRLEPLPRNALLFTGVGGTVLSLMNVLLVLCLPHRGGC